MGRVFGATVVAAFVMILPGCSLPTDGPKRAVLNLTVAEQQQQRQLFSPDVTVVQSAEVRVEVDGRTTQTERATVGQGQSLIQMEVDLPEAPADFVATILSNNGTRLLEGRTDPITPADGDRVNIRLSRIAPIPGLSPDTVVVAMSRIPGGPGVSGRLTGFGVVRFANFGISEQSWGFGAVNPGGSRCTSVQSTSCQIALFNSAGEFSVGGTMTQGVADSLFVVVVDQPGTYEVNIDTGSGTLRTVVVADSTVNPDGPETWLHVYPKLRRRGVR